MAQHRFYAKNGRTVVQKEGTNEMNIVTVDPRIDTDRISLELVNRNKPSERWVMKFDEILDENGAQIDATGTDLNVVLEHVTTSAAFSSAPGGSGAILTHTVILGPSELNNLAVTDPELLPDPGAGKINQCIKAIAHMKVGANPYVDGNNGNYFITKLNLPDLPANLIVTTVDRFVELYPLDSLTNTSSRENQASRLAPDDPAPGYPNSGDGTLTIKFWYTIEDVA